MIFYFNANGNLVDMITNQVNQGSNKVNTFYFIGPFPSTAQVTARFSLVNNEVVPATLLKVSNVSSSTLYNSAGTGLNVWEGCLDKYVTKYCGNVFVQFAVTSSTDTTTTQTVSFTVRKGLPQNANISISDENILDELLEKVAEVEEDFEDAIQTKLGKVSTSTVDKQAYIKEADGTQSMVNVAEDRISSIVLRKANGNIVTGTPTLSNEATSKQYVDNLISSSTNGLSDGKKKFTLVEKIVVGYSTLLTQPSDWETNYTAYYRNTGTRINPTYVQITDSVMPTWELGVYFSYNSDGVSIINRSYETTGVGYSFEGMLALFDIPVVTRAFYPYFYVYENGEEASILFFTNFSGTSTSSTRSFYNEVIQYDNFYCCESVDANQWGLDALKNTTKSYIARTSRSIANNKKIARFSLITTNSGNFPPNTKVYIYKVVI